MRSSPLSSFPSPLSNSVANQNAWPRSSKQGKVQSCTDKDALWHVLFLMPCDKTRWVFSKCSAALHLFFSLCLWWFWPPSYFFLSGRWWCFPAACQGLRMACQWTLCSLYNDFSICGVSVCLCVCLTCVWLHLYPSSYCLQEAPNPFILLHGHLHMVHPTRVQILLWY